MRHGYAVAVLMMCHACTQQPSETRKPIESMSTNSIDGPVPQGRIVELPMDSISNQEMDENVEAIDEQQIVVSDT